MIRKIHENIEGNGSISNLIRSAIEDLNNYGEVIGGTDGDYELYTDGDVVIIDNEPFRTSASISIYDLQTKPVSEILQDVNYQLSDPAYSDSVEESVSINEGYFSDEKYNEFLKEFNSRCGSFRYGNRKGPYLMPNEPKFVCFDYLDGKASVIFDCDNPENSDMTFDGRIIPETISIEDIVYGENLLISLGNIAQDVNELWEEFEKCVNNFEWKGSEE